MQTTPDNGPQKFESARENLIKFINKPKFKTKTPVRKLERILILCFDFLTRPKMSFKVMHRK